MPTPDPEQAIDRITRAITADIRRWILLALSNHELCPTDLSILLGFERYAISKHLRVLRENGLIEETRNGHGKTLALSKYVVVERDDRTVKITVYAGKGEFTTMQFVLAAQTAHSFDEYAAMRERVSSNEQRHVP